MRAKLAHQLIQPHDADFRVAQGFEMQQVFKFLFVLLFGLFLHREQNFVPGVFQNIGDVLRVGFARFTVFRQQPQTQLLDFGRRPFWGVDLARGFQDHRFFVLEPLGHRTLPRCCCFCCWAAG